MEEVALDQEAEGFDPSAEGVPLVPISREAIEAMASPLFTKLLRGVGVVPPADEQEAYWRIPSSLHFETIRRKREMILKAVDKELVAADKELVAADESSDDDDLFDRLRGLRGQQGERGQQEQPAARKRSRSADSQRAPSTDVDPREPQGPSLGGETDFFLISA